MGGSDIVLGDEWICTLRSITMDFRELYMNLFKDTHAHMFQGIKVSPLEIISAHYMENLLNKGHSGIIVKFHAIQGWETTPLYPPSIMK